MDSNSNIIVNMTGQNQMLGSHYTNTNNYYPILLLQFLYHNYYQGDKIYY